MNKLKHLSSCLLLALSLLFTTKSTAQDYEIGLMLGLANYQGDLVVDFVDLNEMNLSYGVYMRYHLNDRFTFRMNAFFGQLSGDERISRPERSFYFHSDIFETSALVEYHIFGTHTYGNPLGDIFDFYLFTGPGLVIYHPSFTGGGNIPDYDETGATYTVPIGGGVTFKFSEHTLLGLELGARITGSDKLDGLMGGARDYYVIGGLNISVLLNNY